MIDQQDNLNGSAQAFIRAFSDLIKDGTSHLATKEDIAKMATKDDIAKMATKDDIKDLSDRIGRVEETVAEGYKRIYSWRDEMYKTFPRKDELRPSAFKKAHP